MIQISVMQNTANMYVHCGFLVLEDVVATVSYHSQPFLSLMLKIWEIAS